MEKEIIAGKSLEEKMTVADEISRGYFRQGLNCAECLVLTIMDMYETDLPAEAVCMASGFGGGIGHTKNICGAITGAVMAVGAIKGRRNPCGPKEEMRERIKHLQGTVYPIFARMVEEIEKDYGTLICREMSQSYEDFDSKPRMKNCMEIIAYCARLTVRYIEE